MSHHLDREEFVELLKAGASFYYSGAQWKLNDAWKSLWDAYQYAVNGGESSTVDFQKELLEATKNAAVKEIKELYDEIEKLKEFQLAKEKTVEILKEEIKVVEETQRTRCHLIYQRVHLASDLVEFLLDRTKGWGSTGIYAEQADEDELHDGLKNIREQLGKIKEILADN